MTDFSGGDGAMGDRLVNELQRRILDGQYPVGSWLRHGAIAEEFGVSRTPVREALRVLQAQGIVAIAQNRGARVIGLSSRDIRELGEVRAELEGLAAELATHRINDEQLERMRAAIDEFGTAMEDYSGDRVRSSSPEAATMWRENNEAFHGVIVEASGNRQLRLSIEDVSRRLPRNNYSAYAGNSRLLRQNFTEHAAVADAIVARDARKARMAMTKHLRSAAESLASWVEDSATRH